MDKVERGIIKINEDTVSVYRYHDTENEFPAFEILRQRVRGTINVTTYIMIVEGVKYPVTLTDNSAHRYMRDVEAIKIMAKAILDDSKK